MEGGDEFKCELQPKTEITAQPQVLAPLPSLPPSLPPLTPSSPERHPLRLQQSRQGTLVLPSPLLPPHPLPTR